MTARYKSLSLLCTSTYLKRQAYDYKLNRRPRRINRVYYFWLNELDQDKYYYKLTPGYPLRGNKNE